MMENRILALTALLICGVAAWPGGTVSSQAADKVSPDASAGQAQPGSPADLNVAPARIARLIGQLGSEQYILRERAREELSRLDLAAFDALQVAADHEDQEIAHHARYLVRKINIPWVASGDPPEVRSWMGQYNVLGAEDRLLAIRSLGDLEARLGVPPLLRIVRFETSAVLAKKAALKLISNMASEEGAAWEQQFAAARAALGTSQRTAADWMRTALLFGDDPSAALKRWSEHLAWEQKLLAQGDARTDSGVISALIRNQVELLEQTGQQQEAIALVGELLKLEEGSPDTLRDMVGWLAERDAWPLVEKLVDRFERQFAEDVFLLYDPAEQQRKAERKQAADRLAAFARDRNPVETIPHWQAAYQLEERGLKDWSEAEYRIVIDRASAAAPESIFATYRLAEMLHDQLRERDAARVMQQLVQAMNKDDAVTRTVLRADLDPDAIRSRAEYFMASHYEQQENFARQKEHLDRGIQHDRTDADILIAMHRLRGVDAGYREHVSRLIKDAAAEYREEIRLDPDDATPRNQFAWLISNTEGDYQEALRHSKRSVELRPDSAAYLDTLGRCYYAVGDLDNAIRYQQRAVDLSPHVEVIARQLKFFKAEKAKQQQQAGTAKPPAEQSDAP